jgi:hypothetical protein
MTKKRKTPRVKTESLLPHLITTKIKADVLGSKAILHVGGVDGVSIDQRQTPRLVRELCEMGVAVRGHLPDWVEVTDQIYGRVEPEPVSFDGSEWHDDRSEQGQRHRVRDHGMHWATFNQRQQMFMLWNPGQFLFRWVNDRFSGREFRAGEGEVAHEEFREEFGRFHIPTLIVYTSAWVEREKLERRGDRVQALMGANFAGILVEAGLATEAEAKEIPKGFLSGGRGLYSSTIETGLPETWGQNLDGAIVNTRDQIARMVNRLELLQRMQRDIAARGGWAKILAPIREQFVEFVHAEEAALAAGDETAVRDMMGGE